MTYSAVYCALIEKRRQHSLQDSAYGEVHHIIPKSEGGDDSKENLVRLSAREHYVAHLLLAKIYDDYKMYSALVYMQSRRHKKRKFKFNSRLYEKLREEYAKKISNDNHWTHRHPEKVRRGFKYSESHNKKLSEIGKTKTGKLNNFYGKHHSEEARRKMSLVHKGVSTYKTAAKLRGRKLSSEHKQKDREAMLGMKFWNNGFTSIRALECPSGFVAGRLKKKKQ